MAIKLITPPAAAPLTLTETKAHLRVDHNEDDLLIDGLLKASTDYCQQFTARAFVSQTWELVLDEFPVNEVLIPMPPLQSVTSVKYDDANGFEQTVSVLEYTVDDVSEPGWVVPSTSGWPSSIFQGINAVRIRFVAGYDPGTNSPVDLAANVPQAIKAAILLHVGQLYAQREDIVVGTVVNRVPTGGIEHLLRQYRVALGMA
jgi:uncharacterized phiE125 gp8 family phage protein